MAELVLLVVHMKQSRSFPCEFSIQSNNNDFTTIAIAYDSGMYENCGVLNIINWDFWCFF